MTQKLDLNAGIDRLRKVSRMSVDVPIDGVPPEIVRELFARLEQAEQLARINNQAMLEQTQRAGRAEQQVARVREVIRQYDMACLTCQCDSDGDCCKCTVADFQEALDGESNE